MCSLERLAERLLRLADVAEGQRGKADPAEGGDRAPPVVDLAERLVAGPSEPQRLLVLLRAVGAETRAAQRVAGPAYIPHTGEQLVRLHVQAHRVAVALLGIGEEPELARGICAQKRVAQLLREDVRSLERLARRFEVVPEEVGEAEIHQSPALGEPVAYRSRDLRRLFGERDRLRIGVPIHSHDAQRA